MVSIIIPVYNALSKLPIVIDSILKQTYQDYEVLLVDDGSNDGSDKLCDDYSEKYPHFRAFHKINGGQSSARNLGIKEAKGEYIYFADDDDELLPNCLETLVKGMTSQDGIDWAIGKALCTLDDKLVNEDNKLVKQKILTKEELLYEFFRPKWGQVYGPWCHLFKLAIVREHQVYFREDMKGIEDRVYMFDYLYKVKGKIFHTTQPIYMWNVGIGTSHTISTEYNPWYATIFYAQCEIYKNLKEYGFSKKILWLAKHTMINSYFDKKRFYEKYGDRETVKQINKRFYELATDRDLTLFKLRNHVKFVLSPILLLLRKLR